MPIKLKLKLAAFVVFCVAMLCPGYSLKPRAATSTQASIPPEKRIDINHATLEELLKAPGMTRSWAGRIIRFRPYRSKQDLVQRGIVPAAVYLRIKDGVIAHRDGQ